MRLAMLLFLAFSAVGVGQAQNGPGAQAATYARNCASGSAIDCGGLGVFYATGADGLKLDNIKAAEFYRMACDGGSLGYCNNLAVLYEYGSDVDRDAKAFALRKRSCDGGVPAGCAAVARMFEHGKGVDKDEAHAAELYDRTCRTYLAACLDWARVNADGIGVDADKRKAATIYHDACRRSLSPACNKLAAMMVAGEGMKPDVKGAIKLYRRTCDIGDKEGCKRFDELTQ